MALDAPAVLTAIGRWTAGDWLLRPDIDVGLNGSLAEDPPRVGDIGQHVGPSCRSAIAR